MKIQADSKSDSSMQEVIISRQIHIQFKGFPVKAFLDDGRAEIVRVAEVS